MGGGAWRATITPASIINHPVFGSFKMQRYFLTPTLAQSLWVLLGVVWDSPLMFSPGKQSKRTRAMNNAGRIHNGRNN